MDILISSNLERLLYFIAGAEETRAYMEQLNKEGAYTVSDKILSQIREDFYGYYASEEATANAIRESFSKHGYLIDTHTAVAASAVKQYRAETCDDSATVIASTASPYKFAADVLASLTGENPSDPLEALDILSEKTGTDIPYPLKDIGTRKIRFSEVIEKTDMQNTVYSFTKNG